MLNPRCSSRFVPPADLCPRGSGILRAPYAISPARDVNDLRPAPDHARGGIKGNARMADSCSVVSAPTLFAPAAGMAPTDCHFSPPSAVQKRGIGSSHIDHIRIGGVNGHFFDRRSKSIVRVSRYVLSERGSLSSGFLCHRCDRHTPIEHVKALRVAWGDANLDSVPPPSHFDVFGRHAVRRDKLFPFQRRHIPNIRAIGVRPDHLRPIGGDVNARQPPACPDAYRLPCVISRIGRVSPKMPPRRPPTPPIAPGLSAGRPSISLTYDLPLMWKNAFHGLPKRQ